MARDRILKQYLRRRFLITTKDDQTWSGVVLEADAFTLRLHDAELINRDQTRTKADGQVFLPRADIAYMQHAP